MEKLKKVSKYSFKSNTAVGEPCKFYITIFNTGVHIFEQVILTDREIPAIILTKRFGKTLYLRQFSIKFQTMQHIMQTFTKIYDEKHEEFNEIL